MRLSPRCITPNEVQMLRDIASHLRLDPEYPVEALIENVDFILQSHLEEERQLSATKRLQIN